MPGYIALLLHAHLPFVRHPEHERFLEESWFYEAITETYLPLIQILDGWRHDSLQVRLTLTLTPTLCSMLLDPLLQDRFERRLDGLIELAEKETFRTHWDTALHPLAEAYRDRFLRLRATWLGCDRNLVLAFRRFQDAGLIEIITCAASHAVLPLLAVHPAALRGQILTARDHHAACFGSEPRGIWLPECAYALELEPVLVEANLRWFVLDTHGLLRATPRPRCGVHAPVFTPNGIAVFGRDSQSATQVWSRHQGYPGDPRYRDFYRDIGFDLDFDYLQSYLPSPGHRGFTGIKYHRITSRSDEKAVYDPAAARAAVVEHAAHFLATQEARFDHLAGLMDLPPLLVAPYDAELFGHWWHEGIEFLDAVVRRAQSPDVAIRFITPSEYLRKHPTHQIASPSPSSWGEEGYWAIWLNEKNQWILPHLRVAGQRMTNLVRQFARPTQLDGRALRQAARELLLAQASDWPFILHTGAGPEYARRRVTEHLACFTTIHDQLLAGTVNEAWLASIETRDNLFPEIDVRYWA